MVTDKSARKSARLPNNKDMIYVKTIACSSQHTYKSNLFLFLMLISRGTKRTVQLEDESRKYSEQFRGRIEHWKYTIVHGNL
jgi:hypothetical protein